MIRILVLALAVAAVNVAAGRWFQRAGSGDERFLRMQALGFAFRFATIFGAAGWVWAAHRRAPEVVMFIVTGAVVQMVGQIYFLTRNKKPYA